MAKPKQMLPPERPWTPAAKFSVAVACWTFILAGIDWMDGEGWWTVGLLLLSVANVLGAARLVRSNWEWREAHARFEEFDKKS